MARTTRSSNKNEEKPKENPTESPKAAAKGTGKKRKRLSTVDNEEQPAAKLARSDTSIKEEDTQDSLPTIQLGAGDVPLDAYNAQRILAILEKIDTQGLLDREFPLPQEALLTDPQSSTLPRTYSFRALLKDAPRHSLRVLHAAVKPLFPVFSHPRSRPSGPAAQQLKFCTLARQLLDQTSHGLNPTVGELVTLIPQPNDDIPSTSAQVPHPRKYALMQKLPTGNWWSSLNSSSSDVNELKDLITGHAELVAILPTPTGTLENTPTLGDYARPKASTSTRPLPGKPQASRRITTGSFLDYGPYASFAPTFDQDGSEIGRVQLGEVLWAEDRKRKLARSSNGSTRSAAIQVAATAEEDVEMDEPEQTAEPVIDPLLEGLVGPDEKDELEGLTGILPPEEVEAVRATLTELDIEAGVNELMQRTSSALLRLEELQNERLGGPNGGKSKVDPESEEFAVAESIHKSLALVTSLRPRASTSSSSLIPPPATLRQLHRTLPISPAPGWNGTLPSTKSTALHDDATIYVKPGAILNGTRNPSATPSTPIPPTPGSAYKGTTGYSYQYPGYTPTTAQTQYRPPAQNTQYAYQANGQPLGSYLNYASQAGQTQAYPQYTASTTQSGTPTTPATAQTQYYNNPQWYGATAQRAVANTVTPAKAYTGYQGNYTPTLAMRAAGPGTPGTYVQQGQ